MIEITKEFSFSLAYIPENNNFDVYCRTYKLRIYLVSIFQHVDFKITDFSDSDVFFATLLSCCV